MQKTAPEEQFKKSFPENKCESFDETAVKGVYEVYDGHRVYYYLPDGDVIILGNMISKDKRNLTRESEGKKMAAGLSDRGINKSHSNQGAQWPSIHLRYGHPSNGTGASIIYPGE